MRELVARLWRSGLLRGVLVLGNVAFAVVVARRWGVAALGIAGTAQLFVRVGSELLSRGWPTIVIADSPGKQPGQTVALGGAALRLTVLAAISRPALIASAVLVTSSVIGILDKEHLLLAAAWAALLVAFGALRVVGGTATGIGRIDMATISDMGLPAGLSTIVLLVIPVWPQSAEGRGALIIGVLATSMFLTVAVLWRRMARAVEPAAATPSGTSVRERWLTAANAALVPLATVLGPAYLSLRGDAREAGAFVGVLRLTVAGPVILSVLAPIFARRLADPERRVRRRALLESQLVAVVVFTPFAGAVVLLQSELLEALGEDFVDRGDLLLIVLAGQAVNVATGASSQLLNLARSAGRDTQSQILGVVSAVILLLLSDASAEAAAYALLASQVVRNGYSTWYAYRT